MSKTQTCPSRGLCSCVSTFNVLRITSHRKEHYRAITDESVQKKASNGNGYLGWNSKLWVPTAQPQKRKKSNSPPSWQGKGCVQQCAGRPSDLLMVEPPTGTIPAPNRTPPGPLLQLAKKAAGGAGPSVEVAVGPEPLQILQEIGYNSLCNETV